MSGIEIITDGSRRRRWSSAEKLRIVRRGSQADHRVRGELVATDRSGLGGARLQHAVAAPEDAEGQRLLSRVEGPLHLLVDRTGITVEGEGCEGTLAPVGPREPAAQNARKHVARSETPLPGAGTTLRRLAFDENGIIWGAILASVGWAARTTSLAMSGNAAPPAVRDHPYEIAVFDGAVWHN
jgi:hypothetical protein